MECKYCKKYRPIKERRDTKYGGEREYSLISYNFDWAGQLPSVVRSCLTCLIRGRNLWYFLNLNKRQYLLKILAKQEK